MHVNTQQTLEEAASVSHWQDHKVGLGEPTLSWISSFKFDFGLPASKTISGYFCCLSHSTLYEVFSHGNHSNLCMS